MYTFKDSYTGEAVYFDSIQDLTLEEVKDYVTGKVTEYIVEVNGIPHNVDEAFYNKVKEDKGL